MSTIQERNEARLLAILRSGTRSSQEIRQTLGISQPSVSRLLSALSGQIVSLGRARATRYARPRALKGVDSKFPIYKVDEAGDVRLLGELTALQGGQYWWNPAVQPGELFDQLPWFIQDMCPDGFIGRAFAHARSIDLGLPQRLENWNDDHTLIALTHNGSDCTGNLIIGENSLARYFQATRQPTKSIHINDRAKTYPELIRAAMASDPPVSSVGGDQPKFAALVNNNGELRNVLVKFSPSTKTTNGRRWADLLICEHIALQIVQQHGIDATQSELLEIDNRVLLEVIRFDRCGRFGRRPMISLNAIDNEFFGEVDNWVAAAGHLENNGMLSRTDADRLRWLALFGNLIANTDQHFDNVSLIMVDGRRHFSLAPAYDMLPMLYRPVENELHARTFNPPMPSTGALSQWESAQRCAIEFWETAMADERVSPEFREICALNREIVLALREGPRLLP